MVTGRFIAILLFLFLTCRSYSQHGLQITALNRYSIRHGDTLYTFFAKKPEKKIKVIPGRDYYWYNQDTILVTREGYDGWVLDGEYKGWYPNHNLKVQGNFSKGLKEGEWKYWFADGRLEGVQNWNKGELLATTKDKKDDHQ